MKIEEDDENFFEYSISKIISFYYFEVCDYKHKLWVTFLEYLSACFIGYQIGTQFQISNDSGYLIKQTVRYAKSASQNKLCIVACMQSVEINIFTDWMFKKIKTQLPTSTNWATELIIIMRHHPILIIILAHMDFSSCFFWSSFHFWWHLGGPKTVTLLLGNFTAVVNSRALFLSLCRNKLS